MDESHELTAAPAAAATLETETETDLASTPTSPAASPANPAKKKKKKTAAKSGATSTTDRPKKKKKKAAPATDTPDAANGTAAAAAPTAAVATATEPDISSAGDSAPAQSTSTTTLVAVATPTTSADGEQTAKPADTGAAAAGGGGGGAPSRSGIRHVEDAAAQAKKVNYIQLYRYSDKLDRGVVAWGVLCSAIHGALTPIISVIFGQFIDAFADPVALVDAVDSVAVWFLILGAISLVATSFQAWTFSFAGKRQADRIWRLYFQAVLRQEIGWYDLNDSSQMTSRVASNVLLIQEALSEQVGTFFQYITTCVVGFIIGFAKSWKLTLVILALIPPLAAAGVFLGKLTSRLSAQVTSAHALAGGAAEEVISNVRTVMAFGGEQTEINRYRGLLDSASAAGTRKAHVHGFSLGGVFLAAFSAFGLAFWYGSVLVRDGELSAGDVLVVFFSIVVGATSIGNAAPAMQAFSAGTGAAAHIFEMIERVPAIDVASPAGEQLPDDFEPTLRLENVDFAYPSRPDVPISRNLSLHFPAGKTVALVGFSGSGKSTVVSLIERFYDPVAGRVTLAGRDLRDLNLAWLRRQIALVGQEPVLFNTTIGQNIAYGATHDDVTQEQIEAAARAANAHDFISRLPKGYNTVVGERGVQLSGGQKQRIAIARALVKNPRILLLDEATSALDTASERIVQDALDRARQGRTTVVIAHRLSTIRDSDLIYVMDRGTVVESGTWAELTSRPTRFAELVEAQMVRGAEETALAGGGGSGSSDAASRGGANTKDEDDAPSVPSEDDADVLHVVADAAEHLVPGAVALAMGEAAAAGATDGAPHLPAKAAAADGDDSAAVAEPDAKEDAAPGDWWRQLLPKRRTKQLPPSEAKAAKQALWRALRMNAPEGVHIFFGVLGGAGHGAVLPCFALIFSQIMTVLIKLSIPNFPDYQEQVDQARFWALMFVVLGGASGIANYLQSALLNISGDRLTQRLRGHLFTAIMKQDLAFFDFPDNGVGRLTTKLASDALMVEQAAGLRFGIYAEIFASIFTGLFISFWYCWEIALVVLATFPLLLAGSAARAALKSGFAREIKKAYETSGQIASEAVLAIRTVAALGREATFLRIYSERVEQAAARSKKSEILSAGAFGLADFVSYPVWALAFWLAGQLVNDGRFSFEETFTAVMAVIFGLVSIGRLALNAPNIGSAAIAAQDIFAIIDRVPAIDTLSEQGLVPDRPVTGDLALEGIQFAYPLRPTITVLNDMSLTIRAGTSVALVGQSGCGKSTTIQLLERFYDPRSGTVRVDGVDVRDLNVHWLRGQLGLVQQEPVLFARSIRENLLYGRPDATEEEMIDAAKRANIHNFVSQLPGGYDTFVGDRGAQLSGGQKQRIAIARAILRNPKVLLLDEATSALDSESEKLVQAALDEARVGRTSVVIGALGGVPKKDGEAGRRLTL